MVRKPRTMYIYCDESGSFAISEKPGSWCVIVSYVLSESQRTQAKEILRRFKLRSGARYNDEVKRKNVTETDYLRFIEELVLVGGMTVAVATDSSANHGASSNQNEQVRILRLALRESNGVTQEELSRLIADMSALSPQLYVEYGCRLHLAWRTIRLAVLYFAERNSATLGRFCWQLDDKPKTLKDLYSSSIPGFIRELAKREPLHLLQNADYRHLAHFLVPAEFIRGNMDGELPSVSERIFDAARMMTEDVHFVDSRTNFGVQIADLIANGLRACLRGEFVENERAALLLGRLLFDKETESQILPLIFFTPEIRPSIDQPTMELVAKMGMAAQRLSMLPHG